MSHVICIYPIFWTQTVCRKMKRLSLDMSNILASDPVAVCEVSCLEFYNRFFLFLEYSFLKTSSSFWFIDLGRWNWSIYTSVNDCRYSWDRQGWLAQIHQCRKPLCSLLKLPWDCFLIVFSRLFFRFIRATFSFVFRRMWIRHYEQSCYSNLLTCWVLSTPITFMSAKKLTQKVCNSFGCFVFNCSGKLFLVALCCKLLIC